MKKKTLGEIKKITSSPLAKVREEKIRCYVQSQPDYSPGRKRPKDANEANILARFTK